MNLKIRKPCPFCGEMAEDGMPHAKIYECIAALKVALKLARDALAKRPA